MFDLFLVEEKGYKSFVLKPIIDPKQGLSLFLMICLID
jgi:hypothetical protein